ncbi:hypothetical protein AB0F17_35005 [Nonomuraea sp. NPDC026600]|uniref:hypothetical protein n=1 Tax=Nonomuraea sp. NPDC026600 TaxID=3155363 RepID=UPI0033ED805E
MTEESAEGSPPATSTSAGGSLGVRIHAALLAGRAAAGQGLPPAANPYAATSRDGGDALTLSRLFMFGYWQAAGLPISER